MNPLQELPKSFEYIKRYLPKDFIKVVQTPDTISFHIGDADIQVSKITGKMFSVGRGTGKWKEWEIKRK